MKFAYADPPYYGYGKLYAKHHPDALIWDTVEAHRDLVSRLVKDYPDGWAMSLSTPSLKVILPLCPDDVRVMAWVKPFAVFRPNVNPAYAWEPVIVRGGRKRGRDLPTVRDWVQANITLKKGLTGAKPPAFCNWVFDVLGCQQGDQMDDLFPGTGIVGEAWEGRFPDPMHGPDCRDFGIEDGCPVCDPEESTLTRSIDEATPKEWDAQRKRRTPVPQDRSKQMDATGQPSAKGAGR